MKKIMFVCHGNICRSPMAEFIFKDMVKKDGLENEFFIASSATSTEEIWGGIGNPVYPPARAELAKHGIASIEEAKKICDDAGVDAYNIVKGIQPICFENAAWAYVVGCAIALKDKVANAAEAAEKIGLGLQSCVGVELQLGIGLHNRFCNRERGSKQIGRITHRSESELKSAALP